MSAHHRPRVILVAACNEDRVIGIENRLPWRLPADLKRFRALTRGQVVIMGRKTYESIGRPLPDRLNLVISRDPQRVYPGVTVVPSLEAALAQCADRAEVYVIGGGEIYRQALPLADRLEMTLVESRGSGDATFPDWTNQGFTETARQRVEAGEGNEFAFSFVTLDRPV